MAIDYSTYPALEQAYDEWAEIYARKHGAGQFAASAIAYLRAAAEILAMPGGPSRGSAATAIKLARRAADQVEARLGDYVEIDLGELIDVTLAAIEHRSDV